MARRGDTRERLLDIAETQVLAKGFGATSIEEIITEAEITKSGFFYHFRDKGVLARALIERYIRRDDEIFDDIFARGRDLSDDPLQAMLISLKLFAELLDDIEGGHPGCLIATYAYQERLFDRDVHALNREALISWRNRFMAAFEEIARTYPPREPVDLSELADMVTTVIEGGIVMSKALGDPQKLPEQVLMLRSFLKLLFEPVRN